MLCRLRQIRVAESGWPEVQCRRVYQQGFSLSCRCVRITSGASYIVQPQTPALWANQRRKLARTTTFGNSQVVWGVSIYMGRTLQAGFELLVVILVARDGLPQNSPTMRSLSICDVRSHSKRYFGKVVTVTGEVERTGHGVSMSSSQFPTVGAALVESNAMEKSRALESERFRDGTWKTYLCTDNRVFVATVRGRFGTAVSRGISICRIVIDKVVRAEFTEQTAQHCMNREIPLPPDIKIPPEGMTHLSH